MHIRGHHVIILVSKKLASVRQVLFENDDLKR